MFLPSRPAPITCPSTASSSNYVITDHVQQNLDRAYNCYNDFEYAIGTPTTGSNPQLIIKNGISIDADYVSAADHDNVPAINNHASGLNRIDSAAIPTVPAAISSHDVINNYILSDNQLLDTMETELRLAYQMVQELKQAAAATSRSPPRGSCVRAASNGYDQSSPDSTVQIRGSRSGSTPRRLSRNVSQRLFDPKLETTSTSSAATNPDGLMLAVDKFLATGDFF